MRHPTDHTTRDRVREMLAEGKEPPVIAKLLGVSRQRVHQIRHANAIRVQDRAKYRRDRALDARLYRCSGCKEMGHNVRTCTKGAP